MWLRVVLLLAVWGLAVPAPAAETDRQCAAALKSAGDAAPARNWVALEHRSQALLDECGEWLGQQALMSAVYRWLITAELNQNNFTAAAASIAACRAAGPGDPGCLVLQGTALELQHQNDAALTAYQAALALGNPQDPLADALKDRIATLSQTAPHNAGSPALPGLERHAGVSSGTAFFVNRDGVLLTNAHVVTFCRRIETVAGAELRLLASDSHVDLAVLASDHPAADAASFAAVVPQVGDDVIAFGFPLPGVLSADGIVTEGIISASAGMGNDQSRWQISAGLQPGNSGGPIFDRSGHVIGIAVATLDAVRMASTTGNIPQNVNFAVKAEMAEKLLDGLHLGYDRRPGGDPVKTALIAATGKAVAVQVLCSH